MAHYFVHQERIGPPFRSVRELKMVIPAGAERRQASKHPKIVFILGGECGVRLKDGFAATLRQGDVLLVPRPCHHYYTSLKEGEDAELFIFGLFFHSVAPAKRPGSPCEAEWFRLLGGLFSGNRHLPAMVDPQMHALINVFRQEHRSAEAGSLLKQKLIAQELVIELSRRLSHAAAGARGAAAPQRSHAFIVSEVKEFLGKTVDRSHSLPEVAWRFRMSEEHLARIFKKETGISVMAYLRKIRVEAAQTMLLSTNHTVASLAAALGFSSSNHFCRAFFQCTGQTPSEYRGKHAGMTDPAEGKKPR